LFSGSIIFGVLGCLINYATSIRHSTYSLESGNLISNDYYNYFIYGAIFGIAIATINFF